MLHIPWGKRDRIKIRDGRRSKHCVSKLECHKDTLSTSADESRHETHSSNVRYRRGHHFSVRLLAILQEGNS
jgi:hypothetical protein